MRAIIVITTTLVTLGGVLFATKKIMDRSNKVHEQTTDTALKSFVIAAKTIAVHGSIEQQLQMRERLIQLTDDPAFEEGQVLKYFADNGITIIQTEMPPIQMIIEGKGYLL